MLLTLIRMARAEAGIIGIFTMLKRDCLMDDENAKINTESPEWQELLPLQQNSSALCLWLQKKVNLMMLLWLLNLNVERE